ncbi:hypothetical protein NDU88_004422 [Pleurodeles waltl]|uniref:Uncharacterized protein n=1 Tax=Pleurodeles waltl TaxID=8319 RepID=A0AAV7KYC8_PLEWA|nr:hypothetical protein NDU88_004422 [Pleurodeles waltl]
MATGGSSAAKESGACSSGSPQSRGSSSHEAGLQHPYHSAAGCEMATGGSVPLRSLGLVVQALHSHEEVRPAEGVCSVLITVPPGTKWQPAALVPLRSLGLVVQAPPSHKEVWPAERVCSVLITAPLGAKWQPAPLVPLRSLGLVVQAPPPVTRKLSRRVGL